MNQLKSATPSYCDRLSLFELFELPEILQHWLLSFARDGGRSLFTVGKIFAFDFGFGPSFCPELFAFNNLDTLYSFFKAYFLSRCFGGFESMFDEETSFKSLYLLSCLASSGTTTYGAFLCKFVKNSSISMRTESLSHLQYETFLPTSIQAGSAKLTASAILKPALNPAW